jgi:hypothetical protein
MLIEVEKLLITKNAEAMMLPTIVTIRHPNLFASALTIGPKSTKIGIEEIESVQRSFSSSFWLLHVYTVAKQQALFSKRRI